MGNVNLRNAQTSRGMFALSPWIDGAYYSSVIQLLLGSNPLSKLEVVSALNSFNLGRWEYHFNQSVYPPKYNPKVYLSAVQSVGYAWNTDNNSGLSGEQKWLQKSGS